MPLTQVTGRVVQDGSIEAVDLAPITSSGSTAGRTITDRFAERVNIKDFGAIGDGATDDAPALRAAVAYALAQPNRYIYIPRGSYNLNTYTDGTSTNPTFGQYKYIVGVNNSAGATYKDLIICGDEATLTTGLWANNQGNNNAWQTGMSIFDVAGKVNIVFNGISFISRFGGANERPLAPRSLNGLALSGKNMALQVTGSYPSNCPNTVKITDCVFKDWGAAVNIFHAIDVIFNNNSAQWTWGWCSAGQGDSTVALFYRQGKTLACNQNNCECSLESDYTSILGTATGIYAGGNAQFSAAEGLVITTGVEYVQCNSNFILNNSFEAIQCGYSSANAGIGQLICNDNVIDGSAPNAAAKGGNYGIATYQPRQIIQNNNIRQCQAPILVTGNNAGNSNSADTIISGNNIELWNEVAGRSSYGISYYGNSSALIPQNVSITNNSIVGRLVTGQTQNTWDGQIGTFTGIVNDPSSFFTTGIIIGTSNIVGTVKNNVVKIVSKNPTDASKWTMGTEIAAGSITIEDNIFDGVDFGHFRLGANHGWRESSNNTYRNCVRVLAGLTGYNVENITSRDCEIFWQPLQTGWYLLQANFDKSGALGGQGCIVRISTAGETFDSAQWNGNVGAVKSQTVELMFGASHTYPNTLAIHQLLNVGSSPFITKAYATFSSSNVAFYVFVNYISSKIPLNVSGGGGTGAYGYANINSSGVITSVVILGGGSGYTSAPTITVATNPFDSDRARGKGAVLTASVAGGQVTGVAVTNGGSGYGQAVSVQFQNIGFNPDVPTNLLYQASAPTGGIELNLSAGSKCVTRTQDLAAGAVVGYSTPLVGTVAPTSTPEFVGQQYIDTTAGKVYVATNTVNSGGWKILN